MKLFDNKRIAMIIASILLGLLLTAYILYQQSGALGETEIIVLCLTAVFAVGTLALMIKKGNK